MNFEDIKVGMPVKIAVPKDSTMDLDEFNCENEWGDVSYIPEHMKEYIGSESEVETVCVSYNSANVKGWNWPASWLVPIDKFKPEPTAKDFLGQVIKAGDEVVYARKGYRGFRVGKVKNVTPTGVRIVTGVNKWDRTEDTFFQTFTQIVKKP
jgi:hypothetical protein